MKSPKKLGAIDNVRTEAQRKNMLDTIGKGLCPFCDGQGFNPAINKVIWQGKHWRLWHNPFPYDNTQTHLVFATHKHITDISELTPEIWKEWSEINQDIIKNMNIPGGGIVMRFGDLAYNGGSLQHLHSHIIVPNLKGPVAPPLAYAIKKTKLS